MSAESTVPSANAVTDTESQHLRQIITVFRDLLITHRDYLNALNVYPVPDGDTGTNMSLTLTSVVDDVDAADTDLAATCKAISHGSLMGARGNSGVILSQILRGISGVIGEHEVADVAAWSNALTVAAEAAYGAVMRPVEGTILTVVRESAEAAAEAAADGTDLAAMFDSARRVGGESLERTPDLLPALADAGVVDAGGAGFLLFYDAVLHVLTGRELPEPPEAIGPSGANTGHDHDHSHDGGGLADLRYEVMYFLDAPDESVPGFKDAWAAMGDSIVVVGGDGIWNCHIHCDDIGAAIEAGISVGKPHKIRVTDLLEQVGHLDDVMHPSQADGVSLLATTPATTAVVAVAAGDGVRRIFESLGVQAVVTGGQSMNPSTELLLQAVQQVKADEVVILPNNKNIIAVAERVHEATEKSVGVVPARTIAEGFAALLAYDPEAELATNVESMSDAAATVEAGEVCMAVRASKSEAGDIAEGDWLGLTRGGIVAVQPTMVQATCAMLDQLITDDHEIVTLIRGDGADDDAVDQVVDWIEQQRPEIDVEVHDGGQPLYPFYVGVE